MLKMLIPKLNPLSLQHVQLLIQLMRQVLLLNPTMFKQPVLLH
ncbi:hypothetical protein ACYATO_08015 [Lactobacillaceae bacterium Melli_B3]